MGNRYRFRMTASGGGGGDTLKDSNTAVTAGIDDAIGSFAATTYSGGWFQAASSYTLHRLDMPVKKTGTPTFNVSVAIYSDNAGQPGTLASESAQVASSTFAGSETKVTFSSLSASITSGNKYWIIFRAYSSPNDFSNFGNYARSSGGASDNTKIASDGATWSTNNTFALVKFESYGS